MGGGDSQRSVVYCGRRDGGAEEKERGEYGGGGDLRKRMFLCAWG
jgi:hypothetical protein